MEKEENGTGDDGDDVSNQFKFKPQPGSGSPIPQKQGDLSGTSLHNKE